MQGHYNIKYKSNINFYIIRQIIRFQVVFESIHHIFYDEAPHDHILSHEILGTDKLYKFVLLKILNAV